MCDKRAGGFERRRFDARCCRWGGAHPRRIPANCVP
jgi:hypothetical protein